MERKKVIIIVVLLILVVFGYVYFDKYSTLSIGNVKKLKKPVVQSIVGNNKESSSVTISGKKYNIKLEKKGAGQVIKLNEQSIFETLSKEEGVSDVYRFGDYFVIFSLETDSISSKIIIKDINGNVIRNINSKNYGKFKMHIAIDDPVEIIDNDMYITFSALSDNSLVFKDKRLIKDELPYSPINMVRNGITNDSVVLVTYKITNKNGKLSGMKIHEKYTYKDIILNK